MAWHPSDVVVGSVGDGRALLAEAERLRPDVIVLDISMPRLDGIRAAVQILRSPHPARLVFLTVHDDADFAQAALDAGGLGLMEDPFYYTYPPEWKSTVGPRNLIHSWATDTDDPTVEPRWGKGGQAEDCR
jgi:CheY-like chemotaxis protein